jgi:hypothetical protein
VVRNQVPQDPGQHAGPLTARFPTLFFSSPIFCTYIQFCTFKDYIFSFIGV